MRLANSRYVYANPFLEPVSLDAVIAAGDRAVTQLHDPNIGAQERLERTEAEGLIGRFVAGLDARDRALVEAVYWRGVKQADVARGFQVSGAAISKRLARIAARGRVALAELRDSVLLQ